MLIPNWFVIVSIKKAEANCWEKGRGETSGSQEEKQTQGRAFWPDFWNRRHTTTMYDPGVGGNGGLPLADG